MAETPNQVYAMSSFSTTNEAEPTSDFIALNIASLAEKETFSPRVSKSLARKKEMMQGDSINGGDGPQQEEHEKEKHSIAVHMARLEEAVAVSRVSSPTAAGKFRRLGSSRRSSAPWLHPRRVLLIFATLSSMGTLVLLYFTLSMDKTSGNKAP